MNLVRLPLRALREWMAAALYGTATKLPLRGNLVLVQSHTGESLFGNPFYIARHMAEAYPALDVVCVSSSPAADTRRLGPGSRVRWVRKGTPRYLVALARAGYVVNDTSFPSFFTRRDGQRYLQTWHGTPLKTLGRSVPNAMHANLRNLQRNFLQASDILFPNVHTESMLSRDYDLPALWEGRAIRRGYPRNDVLVRAANAPRNHDGRPLDVAYMPTWRGTHAAIDQHAREQVQATATLLATLDARIGGRYRVWVKLHPLVHRSLSFGEFANVLPFPDDVETYEHLARCDVLVTDYSSVMVDFAVSRRPVILHVPDLAEYQATHGFSLPLSDMPFPTTTTADELLRALARPDVTGNAVLEAMLAREDGRASRDVCRDFLGAGDPSPHRPATGTARILLLVAPSCGNQGVGFLQDLIDAHSSPEVTIVLATPGNGPDSEWLNRLSAANPAVAFCPTVPRAGAGTHLLPAWSSPSETRRMFGDAGFAKVLVAGSCREYAPLVRELKRTCPVEHVAIPAPPFPSASHSTPA